MQNNREPLIEPIIYHGPGGCPKCSGPITVADSELTLMELNQDGDPISSETTVRCMGCCMHCGTKIPMMRFKGSYIPYNETSRIIRTMEFKDENFDSKIGASNINIKLPINPNINDLLLIFVISFSVNSIAPPSFV